jgi:hypothetical protein
MDEARNELWDVINNFKQSVFDKIEDLTEQDIFILGEKHIDIGAVVRGSHKKVQFLEVNNEQINFIYIGYNGELGGYRFKYDFNQFDYDEFIFTFCLYVNGKYKFDNAIHMFNGYIDLLQKYFEGIGIQVVLNSNVDVVVDKYGHGKIISAHPIIHLKNLKEIYFYRDLFGFRYSLFLPDEEKRYVYLIYNENNGYFKIGRSKNPLKREKTLQAEEPEIALLKIWEKDAVFEKQLHQKYFKQRVRGEWFKLSFDELWELREM